MYRFSLFYLGRLFGALADQFLLFGIPILIFRVTGDVAWLGKAFVIEWLPRLISLPSAGAVVDRFGPRSVYLAADVLRIALAMISFVLLDVAPSYSLSILLGLAMLSGFFFEQTFIAVEAMIQRLSPVDELERTQAMLQSIDQTCLIAGPLLAGLCAMEIDVVDLLPIVAVLFLCSFLSVLATILLRIEVPSVDKPTRLRIVNDLVTSINTLRTYRKLVWIILLTMLSNLMVGVLLVGLPAIITGIFALPPIYLGLLNTTAGALGIVTILLTPAVTRLISMASLGPASFVLTAVFCLLATLASSFWVFAVLYALLASAEGIFIVYIRVERARLVPAAVYGRTVGAIVMANFLPMPIAGAIVGLGVGQIGLESLVASVAGCGLVLAIPIVKAIGGYTRTEEEFVLTSALEVTCPPKARP
jgi:MFS family permease